MKFTRDKYHLSMAYLGSIILAIALCLDIYCKIKIYNFILVGCLFICLLIIYFKDVITNKKM